MLVGALEIQIRRTVIGIPALAISYSGDTLDELEAWGEPLGRILRGIFAMPFPTDTLFNINLPPIPPTDAKGIRITSLGRRRFSDSLTRAKDPSGREYYWIGGGEMTWTGDNTTDFRAVEEGYVSVTPLLLDLTN